MIEIMKITEQNLADYPQVICFINPKNPYYNLKVGWLKNRFSEGLIIKVLKLPNSLDFQISTSSIGQITSEPYCQYRKQKKQAGLPNEKKIAGFIEYVPGEFAWRGNFKYFVVRY